MKFTQFRSMLYLLNEGGNALGAEPIPVSQLNREELFKKFKGFFKELNDKFVNEVGYDLWTPHSFNNLLTHFSGSTKHVLDHKKTLPEHFKEMGDVDVMVDKNQKEAIIKFFSVLENASHPTFNGIEFVNVHRTAVGGDDTSKNQIITVWKTQFDKNLPPQQFQIDFEFAEMDSKGTPSEFEQFAHSTDYTDLTKNIKGAFHKLLLRAISKKDVASEEDTIKYLMAKDKIKEDKKENRYSFSVDTGLRPNLLQVKDHSSKEEQLFKKLEAKDIREAQKDPDKLKQLFVTVYNKQPKDEELETFKTQLNFDRDLSSIGKTLFNNYDIDVKEKKNVDETKFKSFLGLVCLINEHLLKQKPSIVREFANLLWKVSLYKTGAKKGSKKVEGTLLYRLNPNDKEKSIQTILKDFSVKQAAMKYLLGTETEITELTPPVSLPTEYRYIQNMASEYIQVSLASVGFDENINLPNITIV